MRPIASLFVLALALSACTRRQQPIEMPTPHPVKRSSPSEWPLLSPWSLAQAAQPTSLAAPPQGICPAERS